MAFEAVQGTHGVNVNVAGRYDRDGVPATEYERARELVRDALLAARDPSTAEPLVREVCRREELYSGEAVGHAPDLILVPVDSRFLPRGDPFWANHVSRDLQTGWHSADGFWVGFGPRFSCSEDRLAAAPEDVTATMLSLLGREIGMLRGTPLC